MIMKKSVIFIFLLCISNGFLFSQETNDSLHIYYPKFYSSFSAEESWEIHKEAYIKQLRAKGLTNKEIEKKITSYEKQKEEFISQLNEQIKLAAIQRKKADEQRKLAEIQRVKAEEQRNIAEIQRAKANEQRREAEFQRLKAERQRKQAEIQRQRADEQRKQANELRKISDEDRIKYNIQREKAEIQRAIAEEQRGLAEIQRLKANEQRKLADIQRLKADEQRKEVEKWKNSFDNILNEKITLSGQLVNAKPLIFKVTKKSALLIYINTEISSGTTLIEIFNPNEKKVAELLVEHKTTSGLIEENNFFKSTSGILNKTISDPEVGNWQIKISSQKSEGIANISVAQYKKLNGDE